MKVMSVLMPLLLCTCVWCPCRDVRRALLEADVSLPVVRRFIKKVEEKAAGLEVRGGAGGGQGPRALTLTGDLGFGLGFSGAAVVARSWGGTVVHGCFRHADNRS